MCQSVWSYTPYEKKGKKEIKALKVAPAQN